MRSIVVTITCLCFFYGCDNLFNATPTYTFSGTVIDDSTNQPLPGVGVLVARQDSGEVCEWASGKPCGSGYRPVEELRTDAQGKFRFEYETSAPNSKKHQISIEPCQKAEAECTYEAASFEVEGSWTKQVVRLRREEATVAPQIPLVELQSSFESGFGGWAVAATDTLVGGAGIPWWIRPGTSLAFEGSSADGRLHVVVGVWGTWETERTYYVDALHVQIYPR